MVKTFPITGRVTRAIFSPEVVLNKKERARYLKDSKVLPNVNIYRYLTQKTASSKPFCIISSTSLPHNVRPISQT